MQIKMPRTVNLSQFLPTKNTRVYEKNRKGTMFPKYCILTTRMRFTVKLVQRKSIYGPYRIGLLKFFLLTAVNVPQIKNFM